MAVARVILKLLRAVARGPQVDHADGSSGTVPSNLETIGHVPSPGCMHRAWYVW